MESKRLIPYSVHLREDIYIALKAAAKERKATSMVRDAITMIVEGDDAFNAGYNKGVRDSILEIYEDDIASRIHFDDEVISVRLVERLEVMIVNQNVKAKSNAKKKT